VNVTLIAPRLPPAADGVGDHADALARTLLDAGHDVLAVTAGDADGAPYAIAAAGARWNAAASVRAANIVVRRGGIALLEYTPFLYGARSIAPLTIALAARAAGIPLGIVAHEAFYAVDGIALRSNLKARFAAARDGAVLRAARRVFVVDEGRRTRWAARAGGPERFAVAPIGANLEPPAGYARHLEAARPTLVSFGVVMPRRRLELAIDALATLRAGAYDARLEIAGRIHDDAYARALLAQARERGVAAHVTLLGTLAPRALSTLFAQADVALHLPREGTIASSGSLLAQLAHAVPVVATSAHGDDPRLRAVVVPAAADGDALAATVATLLRDRDAAERRGAAGARLYRNAFGWSIAARTMLRALIDEVSHGRVVPA
jgi:polysaccharide biosynthesis protein PslF